MTNFIKPFLERFVYEIPVFFLFIRNSELGLPYDTLRYARAKYVCDVLEDGANIFEKVLNDVLEIRLVTDITS